MVHHHNFQPYSDAEGIRLLKENWQLGPSSSFYTDALDECYTLALLSPIQVMMTTKTYQKEDDAMQPLAKCSDDSDDDDDSFATDPIDHAHSLTHSTKSAHDNLHSNLTNIKKRSSVALAALGTLGVITVGLLCCGMASSMFFSHNCGQDYALPIEVKLVVEAKTDLQTFCGNHCNAHIFPDLRDLVHKLEDGTIDRLSVYTTMVEGTMPCYGETTMALYNCRDEPHEDSDLFVDYQFRYIKIVRPDVFLAEMIPAHAASTGSHDKVVADLKKIGYQAHVTDRLPSCFCGDHTHRDRWFVLAFLESGPSFDLLDYCSSSPLPARDILDDPRTVDPALKIDSPAVFRVRGEDTHPWGEDYADDPRVSGQYISRATVAGYIGGSHAKEDKFYSIDQPLPCITRNGVQIHDTRINSECVRFATLSEICRASSFFPEQQAHLAALPQHAAFSRVSLRLPIAPFSSVHAR
jgi:site-specific DNA-cytosine methylase